MAPQCSTCHLPLVPAPGPGGQRTHGTVAGTLDGPPSWSCPDGHETRTADVDAALAETLAALTVARRTRLKGTMRCGICDTPFPLMGRRATRSVTLVESGLPATRVTFDVPVVRCVEDAAENLPPECVDDLAALLADLLRPPAAEPGS